MAVMSWVSRALPVLENTYHSELFGNQSIISADSKVEHGPCHGTTQQNSRWGNYIMSQSSTENMLQKVNNIDLHG